MPDLDDDLVKELREQLDAEKEAREELIEELRASRKPEPEEAIPPAVRSARAYEENAKKRRKAGEKEGGSDGS